jgi:predicted ATPase/transcriptional regulator with XRE-family HTH domain
MPQEAETPDVPSTGTTSAARAATFAELLRDLRERSGLSQQELAERAELTPHAISALERGTRTRPYPHTVRSLADALALSDVDRGRLIAAVPRRRGGTSAPDSAPATTPEPGAQPDDAQVPTRFVVPPTQLHGREHDIADLTRIITEQRLVTLTGPGGVGKTRLAAAVSDALSEHYPDGVVRLSLGYLTHASSVMAAIGRALGVAGSDGPETYDVVAAHLRPMTMLLVLDNFEHLLSAAPHVGRLIAQCPRLTILVTSRSPLRVRAELEYAVQPLELPAESTATLEELEQSPAGALVVDRVRALSAGTWLATDDVRALAELCHRLAGLPLALELATAHVRLLGPRALLDRLDEATASSSARDLPPRQRTMRATLDWSFGLLDEVEQRLFTLLGVFRGGADLDAIESVAETCGAFERSQVLDLVVQLVEHSLVIVRPGPDGRHRFTMLEPVAQYARSLVVGDDAAAPVRAHAQVYLRFAEEAATGYEHGEQVAWFTRTELDEANLLVAIERSLDAGDASTAGRITWYLWLYWWLRGQMGTGRRLAEACLATGLPSWEVGRVNLTAATMSYAAGDAEAAARHWSEAARLGEEHGDAEVLAKGLAGTGLAAMGEGDLVAAAERFRSSLVHCEQAGDAGTWMASLVHIWLGTVLLVQSEPAEAVVAIERGLQIARGRGDRLCTYVALYNLAQASLALGDDAAARRHIEEGIALSEETRDLANLAFLLETLAVVESRAGRPERVASLLGAAAGLREVVGAEVYAYYLPDESLGEQAELAARQALGDDAYDDAVDAGRALDLSGVVELALDAA